MTNEQHQMAEEVRALSAELTAIKARAASENREMNADESRAYNSKAGRMVNLSENVKALTPEPTRALQAEVNALLHPKRLSGASAPRVAPATPQVTMSAEYTESFISFLKSNGENSPSALAEGYDPLFGGFALPALPGVSAAVYEGSQGSSNAAGGYAVSVPTDSLIVPLAIPDLGVRALARAIPTATDIKIPRQGTFGTAGWKLESGASSNLFSESDPALEQFTLSAFMTGLTATASWELLQDVQMFQEFLVRDLLNAVDINEDAAFVSGSGTNQPQGLVGATGTGTGAAYAVDSTGAYLLNALDDILGTLKGSYFQNAAFLLSRATFAAIVKAQRQANLFAPVVTRENGRNMIHGFPAVFSQNMPSLPTATTAGVTPILFGSFQDGYVIGDFVAGPERLSRSLTNPLPLPVRLFCWLINGWTDVSAARKPFSKSASATRKQERRITSSPASGPHTAPPFHRKVKKCAGS